MEVADAFKLRKTVLVVSVALLVFAANAAWWGVSSLWIWVQSGLG